MTKERERSYTGPPEKGVGHRSTYSRSRKSRKSGLPAWVYIVAIAVAVVVVGGGAVTLLGQGGSASPSTASDAGTSGVQLPRYAYAAPPIMEAYQFAVTQEGQDVLKYMPCYCGCGDHAGHKNNMNCFIKDPVPGQPLVFDNHGST